MNVAVTVTGVAQTLAQLRTVTQGTNALNSLRGIVGTNVRYAPYVEYGTRYMRGRDFLGRAFGQVNPALLAKALADAVWKGPSEVRRVFNVALFGIQSRAQQNAPVRTGQLRGSLTARLVAR